MNIVLLGAQGAGKGVVSDYLTEKYGYKHISTGQLFREEIARGTELGQTIASYINQGLLLPDQMVMPILKNAMTNDNNCILDGFPRTLAQAEELNNLAGVDLVIYVDAPKNILMERLTSRRHCENCKAGFNKLFYSEENCDKCGGRLIQREDDVPEAIDKRLEIFYQNIEPILHFYKQKNVLYKVDNTGGLEETYCQLEKILKNQIN